MSSKKQPLVSIIMPMYNSEVTIERAVNSVLAQTWANWELLIIDDASQDGSVDVVCKLAAGDSRIKNSGLKRQRGAGVARNSAIEKATGRYVAFLDSDDEWLPEKLEKQICWMLKNDIQFSCTAYTRIKNGAAPKLTNVPQRASRQQLLKNNTVGTLTVIYDTSKLGKCYMSEIRRRQDYGLWLDILKRTDYVFGLQDPLAIYHAGKGTLSSNKLTAARSQWQLFRQQQKFPLLKAAWYFAHYAVNASRRHM